MLAVPINSFPWHGTHTELPPVLGSAESFEWTGFPFWFPCLVLIIYKIKNTDITTNTADIIQLKNKNVRYKHPCFRAVFFSECLSVHPDFSSFRTKKSLSDHFTDSSSPPSILSALRTSNYTYNANWNSIYSTFGFGSSQNQSAYSVTVWLNSQYIVSRKNDEMFIWFLKFSIQLIKKTSPLCIQQLLNS